MRWSDSGRRGGWLACSLAAVLACSSSPTAPGEPVLLVGELTAAATNTYLLSGDNTGVMTLSILDLRAVLWDVTLTGAVFDVGNVFPGEVVTYELRVEHP